jgi:MFS family permease
MGRLCDRYGIAATALCGAAALGLGYLGAALAHTLLLFACMHLVIGLGASATFGPVMADASQWFTRRRGIAVAIAASGNYLGGTVWPPLIQHFAASAGWRAVYIGIAAFCVLAITPLIAALLPRPAVQKLSASLGAPAVPPISLSPNALQILLCVAGLSCCVAMAMPQVHIVAYCGDLGYGVARGAEMLSLMLGFGLVSRVGSGFVADRIGGAPTLLLGSALQGLALFLYLFFDGLISLYVISALFGLFQGGIVPMYAILIRQYFPLREVGTRLGLVLMATLFGMALGGWMSGVIFDVTGSYRAAFMNGLLWNLLNALIVLWLLMRTGADMVRAQALAR